MYNAPPRRNAGLWWTGLILLVVGGALSYLAYISGRPGGAHPEYLIAAVTLCLVGICVVIATAGWWFRH